jgi:hypothetical protein
MLIECAFLRLINNTIIRIVVRKASKPITLSISTILVGWFVVVVLPVVPEDGVSPVFVFCEPTGAVALIVGVKMGVATAVVTAVGDTGCVGGGADAGRGVGEEVGVGVRMGAL